MQVSELVVGQRYAFDDLRGGEWFGEVVGVVNEPGFEVGVRVQMYSDGVPIPPDRYGQLPIYFGNWPIRPLD